MNKTGDSIKVGETEFVVESVTTAEQDSTKNPCRVIIFVQVDDKKEILNNWTKGISERNRLLV